MGGSRVSRRVRAMATTLTAALAPTLLVTGTTGPGAAASPALDTARERAHALRVSVDDLRQQAESATEDYDATAAELADAVAAHLAATQQLQAARAMSVSGLGTAQQ